jgi:hypothetical protein
VRPCCPPGCTILGLHVQIPVSALGTIEKGKSVLAGSGGLWKETTRKRTVVERDERCVLVALAPNVFIVSPGGESSGVPCAGVVVALSVRGTRLNVVRRPFVEPAMDRTFGDRDQ